MPTEPGHLRRGEIIAGAGGLGMLTTLFVPAWLQSAGVTRDGWSAVPVLRWVIAGAALSALALTVAQATTPAPALPVSLSAIATVLSALTALLLVIRLLTTGATPLLGAYLGLLAAVTTTYGSFTSLRTEQGWTPSPDHPIETMSLTRPIER